MRTDKELLKALEPLEEKMKVFNEAGEGSLTAGEVQLLKKCYPDLQERCLGVLPKTFCTSCSSNIKTTFGIYSSWYFRNKDVKD